MSSLRSVKRRRVMSGADGFAMPESKPSKLATPRFESAFETTKSATSKRNKTAAVPPPITSKPRSRANPFAFVVGPSPGTKLKPLQPPPPPFQAPPTPLLKPARPPVLPASSPRRLYHLNSILSSDPADLASVFLHDLPDISDGDPDLTQSPSKRGKFLCGGLASHASLLFTRSHTALTLWKSDNDKLEPAIKLVVVSFSHDGIVFCEQQARFPLSTPPPLTPVLLSGLTAPPKNGQQLLIYKPYQILPVPHLHQMPLLISARYRVSA
ncbi:uncharacterized protein BT62DRAFT_1075356 [Guyanagaster necrorhizus]|uniref:Uncharacterized protein n=1 Tax=Guyanagaster necrorhizus TaxID=856835 RepID=A0A9P7VTP3_9AGAR|nr:uncharacterized protein BT62DRAFT_1075356 [Guyanagaster necrorhizus MCA 3950]KAG7447286.1 hypothetical protein BT62DRAFT_1075356 [Guyanagaster necrorhizus MCA 3950]